MKEDPTVNYQSKQITKEWCGNCGTPIKGTESECPQCGFWFELHEDSIINDEQKAIELTKTYKKNKPVNRVDEDDMEGEQH